MRPQSSTVLGEKFTSSRIRTKATFNVPGEVKGKSTRVTSKRPEERDFVVDSVASMHMMSKRDSCSEEMDTIKRSRTPTAVLTANVKEQTHEEAQVSVYDLNQIRHRAATRRNASRPQGKLCKDNGYSLRVGQRSRATNDKHGKTIICRSDNFVPPVVPGLTTNTGSSSSSTTPSQESLELECITSLWKRSCFSFV